MAGGTRHIGDLIVAGFEGLRASSEILERIKTRRAGGVILFSRNIHEPDQVRELCATLQRARAEVAPTPLIVAIDQEGGTVARLREPWPQLPGNMALGATDDEALAAEAGRWFARLLRPLGVTLNLAPVLDLASSPDNPGIGVRSFGRDPARVGALGLALIRGMQGEGLAATAKHFPGMGDAVLDAHKALPVVGTSWSDMQRFHMAPFRTAMDGGVAAIMTAHCAYPGLERMTRLPATVNRRLWQQIVRREFGYGGAIISDCLEMRAFTRWFSPEVGATNAVMAGVDLLIVSHTPAVQDAVHDSLADAAGRGLISDTVLEEAFARGDALRRFGSTPVDGGSADEGLGDRIAQAAVTVVRGERLPMAMGGRVALFAPPAFLQTEVEEKAASAFEPLLQVLRDAGCTVTVSPLWPDADADRCDAAIVITANAHLHAEQRAAATALLERLSVPVAVAVVRNPFDVDCFPNHAAIATYSDTPPALRTLGLVLMGQASGRGNLPIARESAA